MNLESAPVRRARPWTLRLHGVLRWLHIYTSLFSLLAVLFFAVTGITLNHPDWTFGNLETRQEVQGSVPAAWLSGSEVRWLEVIEHLRATDRIRGRAEDMRVDGTQASVSFAAPGYRADAFLETATGRYTVTVTAQGIVGVLNDFHKGRDSGSGWAWLIDASGVFLAFVSLTGLGLLIYLKKFRTSALLAMLIGAAGVLLLMRLAS